MDASLFRALQEAEQSLVPPELKAKGWIYRDMPGKVTPELWDLFISILGEGEYELLISSEGDDGGGWKRGQFLLSPQAVENLKNYAAARERERAQQSAVN